MKKLMMAVVVTLSFMGFSAPSWAFGHHHHGGSGTTLGSEGASLNSPAVTAAETTQGPGNGAPIEQGSSAPVPEPVSLALLGTGLAGLALKRKMMRAKA